MDGLAMPRNLVEAVDLQRRQAWLAAIPGIVDELRDLWSLQIGEVYQPGGQTAWVAAARDSSGRRLVLKVGWDHPEAIHEADALAVWDGRRGTVRLHAARYLAGTIALLLERCEPGTALSGLAELEQDAVIADLLPQLWIEPPQGHGFRPLREMCEQWAREFERKTAHAAVGLDPGLAREGIALFRQLASDDTRQVLLATDLHAGNVLSAHRQPWLAIDPKPYVGDPTYDALQHMLNCDRRLHADPIGFTACAHRRSARPRSRSPAAVAVRPLRKGCASCFRQMCAPSRCPALRLHLHVRREHGLPLSLTDCRAMIGGTARIAGAGPTVGSAGWRSRCTTVVRCMRVGCRAWLSDWR